jgi:valyl-tRNA synthetase
VPPSETAVLDRWLLQRLVATARATEAGLAAFAVHAAADAVHDWVVRDLCDFYVEAFKARPPTDATAALAVLAGATETGLRLLHPFMPFVTEHLWQALRAEPDAGGALLARAAYPTSQALGAAVPAAVLATADADAAVVARAQGILHAVRSLRHNLGVPPTTTTTTTAGARGMAVAVVVTDPAAAGALTPLLPLLGRMLRVPTPLRLLTAADDLDRVRSSVCAVDACTEVALDLAALPDPGAYLARLRTRAAAAASELVQVDARLARDAARMPTAVLAKWQTQQAALRREYAQLQTDIAALGAVVANGAGGR